MPATDLVVRVVGPAAPVATTTVVLLHGFGAGGDDLVDLAGMLAAPASVRFLFPAAPILLEGDPDGARAWWLIDFDRLQQAMHLRQDRSQEVPEGLAEARALISGLLDQLEAQGADRIVLGGFSQGAMLALDVALHRTKPLAGLALMSATRINGQAWRAGMPRVAGVPVFLAHGTRDPLLPFVEAKTLRDELAGAGADVDWVEFGGGHEIPPPVLAGLGRLIARVAAGV